MAPKVSRRPATAALSETIDHRLKLYSAAAIAAGVGMLALAPPADAEVVVTRKNIQIHGNTDVSIDLNRDGVADFQFSFVTYVGGCSHYGKLMMKPLTGGAVVGSDVAAQLAYASALAPGVKIGPSARFASSTQIEFPGHVHIESQHAWFCSGKHGTPRSYGNWGGDPQNRYLGVRFPIDGVTHYGWIRLTVNLLDQFARSVVITAYAYETVANKPISAGNAPGPAIQAQAQPQVNPGEPSLGMLALGADGLAIWRRDENPVVVEK
jgi:hypothetical protein